jgi:hypothetical protein
MTDDIGSPVRDLRQQVQGALWSRAAILVYAGMANAATGCRLRCSTSSSDRLSRFAGTVTQPAGIDIPKSGELRFHE